MKFKDILSEEDSATITTTTVGNSSTEGGAANFAKKIGPLFQRNPKQKVSGYTSTNKDHKHKVYIDESGNGETSKDNNHSHAVSKGKISKAFGHDHTIEKK